MDVEHFVRGRVDKGFLDFIKEKDVDKARLNDFEYYLCAGREIVEALKIFLEGLGVSKENIFFDKF
jgi:Na+-transporting NADH:ubiquinone oxidoreductase subunit NqrF